MLLERSRYLVDKFLSDNWTQTPVIRDNSGIKVSANTIVPFLIEGDSSQVSIGRNGLHRRLGVLIIQIFVTAGSGTSVVRTRADLLCNLFKNLELENMTFASPTGKRVGEKDGLYQYNVSVPFWIDICQ